MESYCQKLVTVFSGGAFGYHFSVLEFVPLHDVGDLVRSIQAAPFFAGRLTQLEDHCTRRHAAEAAFGLVVRGRTVAKVLSMGLVVLMCFQCSAGRS